jgi:hypothetical protein
MTKFLTQVLDYEVPGATGPDYSASLERPFEIADAWAFGGSSISLTSNLGKVLVPGSAPTYEASSVIVPAVLNGGLETPFDDSASFTEVFAMRRSTSNQIYITGTFGDVSADGGDAILMTGATNIRNQVAIAGASPINTDITLPSITSSTVLIVGLSFSSGKLVFSVLGASTATANLTKNIRASKKRFLGNGGFTNATYLRAVTFYEYQYLARPMSSAELEAQMEAMGARVAAKGFTVLGV